MVTVHPLAEEEEEAAALSIVVMAAPAGLGW